MFHNPQIKESEQDFVILKRGEFGNKTQELHLRDRTHKKGKKETKWPHDESRMDV